MHEEAVGEHKGLQILLNGKVVDHFGGILLHFDVGDWIPPDARLQCEVELRQQFRWRSVHFRLHARPKEHLRCDSHLTLGTSELATNVHVVNVRARTFEDILHSGNVRGVTISLALRLQFHLRIEQVGLALTQESNVGAEGPRVRTRNRENVHGPLDAGGSPVRVLQVRRRNAVPRKAERDHDKEWFGNTMATNGVVSVLCLYVSVAVKVRLQERRHEAIGSVQDPPREYLGVRRVPKVDPHPGRQYGVVDDGV